MKGQILSVALIALSGFIVPAAWGRALGVDVSHHQVGDDGIPQANWDAIAADGRSFAYIKATEGLNPPGNIDPAWQNNVDRATNAGILNGVYHFARVDNRPTTGGAVQEADLFVDTAGSAMTPGHLRPVLDLETTSATLDAAGLTDWVLAFVNEVVAREGPGAEPIIYTTFINGLDSRVADLSLWTLFGTGDPQTATPDTGVFNNWAIWQYNIGSVGGIDPIDEDVLNPTASIVITAVPLPSAASMGVIIICLGAAAKYRNRFRSAAAQ